MEINTILPSPKRVPITPARKLTAEKAIIEANERVIVRIFIFLPIGLILT
jgi:hypothetical protein